MICFPLHCLTDSLKKIGPSPFSVTFDLYFSYLTRHSAPFIMRSNYSLQYLQGVLIYSGSADNMLKIYNLGHGRGLGAYGCATKISALPAEGQFHGCPFKHSKKLSSQLPAWGIKNVQKAKKIIDIAKQGAYQGMVTYSLNLLLIL